MAIDMMNVARPAPQPRCMTCGKPVDSATSSPIMQAGKIIGYRLTYACHGAKAEYEVTNEWIKEPGNLNRPFVEQEFIPTTTNAGTEADAYMDVFVAQFAQVRRQYAETLGNAVAIAMTGTGESPGKDELLAWMQDHKIELIIDHVALIGAAKLSVFVKVDKKLLGMFHFPDHPLHPLTWIGNPSQNSQ